MAALDQLDIARSELVAGRPQGAIDALEAFGARASAEALTDEEQAIVADRLDALRFLAASAAEGTESARVWLRDLERSLGTLQVYDRTGRQQVSTSLAGRQTRF